MSLDLIWGFSCFFLWDENRYSPKKAWHCVGKQITENWRVFWRCCNALVLHPAIATLLSSTAWLPDPPLEVLCSCSSAGSRGSGLSAPLTAPELLTALVLSLPLLSAIPYQPSKSSRCPSDCRPDSMGSSHQFSAHPWKHESTNTKIEVASVI